MASLDAEVKPPIEWDGRVGMPARWYDTGEFGTVRIPHEDWGKWGKKVFVRDYVYSWNGLYFEACGRASDYRLPAPVLWPSGTRTPWIDLDWEPGQPLPTTLRASEFKDGQPRYLNTKQNVYMTAEQMKPPGAAETVGGAIAVCVYLVFVLGVVAMILSFLWWLIIPVALIAGLVWLGKKALQ